MFHDLVMLIISAEQHSYETPQLSPVSCYLFPNILLSSLISNTLNIARQSFKPAQNRRQNNISLYFNLHMILVEDGTAKKVLTAQ
jgi:hypothetical protein